MSGPLQGLRVIDVSRYIAGAHCSLILGDLGADVVKVESAGSGEETRASTPQINGESLYFMVSNRSKRGVTLNFRHPKGPDILRRMAARADVLIENFRPGTMAAMGCSYSALNELNPRLVMVSISGFGQDGPLAQSTCVDPIAQAMSGLQMMNGSPDGPPTKVGTYISDYVTGLYAGIGCLAALRHRDQTGRGQLVDVTLLSSLLSILQTSIPEYLLLGKDVSRHGNRDRYVSPSSNFRSKDGWVCIAAGTHNLFPRLLKAMGREDRLRDANFGTRSGRLEHADELEALVEAWTSKHTSDEIEVVMKNAGVPCAKVCSLADVVQNPQVRHQQQIVEVDHPKVGRLPLHGVTIKLSETPGTIRRGPPTVGQHNEEVYAEWLELSLTEVRALREEGAI